jgi:D-alanyl-D-alanine carboxypeptidase
MRGTDTALEHALARILGGFAARRDTSDVRFALASPSRAFEWEWANEAEPRAYFVASITKLYVTAIVLQLRAEGRVDLERPAITYLDPGVVAGIHVHRGIDHSARITVRDLLAHTSGIADYFEQRRRDGRRLIDDVLAQDRLWTFADVMADVKQHFAPHFPPSTPGRAFYSDTNYQLLGALVESVTGTSFAELLRSRIARPLGLEETYVYGRDTLTRYDEIGGLLHGHRTIRIPLAMASFGADGAVVSTAREGIAFLEAFMGGGLFPAADLREIQHDWRRIFFPFRYGVGLMRFALPRWMSPLAPVPPMVGHSGATGAVLFYAPALDLYVSGTVNQIASRGLVYRLLARVVHACRRAWHRD